jgi:hypothetical protein
MFKCIYEGVQVDEIISFGFVESISVPFHVVLHDRAVGIGHLDASGYVTVSLMTLTVLTNKLASVQGKPGLHVIKLFASVNYECL